jgi:methionyl-tRNA formyltransferase
LVNDRLRPIPQDEALATEWPGRTPEDGRLNRAMTLEEVDRLVRATTRPYPGAFWDDHDKRIRIWRGKFADPATASSPNALRLEFQDGFYDALDFEIEPLCANEA